MSPHRKLVRFGTVAVLLFACPRVGLAEPQPDEGAPTEVQPTGEGAPVEVSEGEEPLPEEQQWTGGPAPEEEFEPPFYGMYFGASVGGDLGLQRRSLCSEYAGCKRDRGYGVGLFLGARFSPMFKLQGAYDAFFHGSSTSDVVAVTQSWRLDGRLTFPLDSNLEPFVQAGFGLYTYGDAFEVDTGGPGLQAGGGVDWAIGSWTSVSLTLLYRGARLESYDDETRISEAIMVHTATAMLGISLGPGI